MSGGVVTASTGNFSVLLAAGGTATLNALAIGTYSLPAVIGASGEVLLVQTGNAVWQANAPATGANNALSNLTTVAFNTSLNTFTGGFATVDRIISTSGAITGLTTFQASTGTFAGNLAVTGTVNASAINVTGGAITAASISIGTYALPATIGSTAQVLTVTSGPALSWAAPSLVQTAVYFRAFATAAAPTTGARTVVLRTEVFDSASVFNTSSYSLEVSASGHYLLGGAMTIVGEANVSGILQISGAGGPYRLGSALTPSAPAANGSVLVVATSGDAYLMELLYVNGSGGVSYIEGSGITYFWGMKIPDA